MADDEIIAPNDPGPPQKIDEKQVARPTSAQVGMRADLGSVMIVFDPGKPSEYVVELALEASALMAQQLMGAFQKARARAPRQPIILDAVGLPIRRH